MKVKLGELINVKTGKLDANAANENGLYPFFTCSKEPLRINTYTYDCECVLVAGNGDLNVKYYKGKFDAYQRTYILESSSNKMYMPYLYFFMDKYVDTLRKQSIGGVIKYIKLENIKNASLELIDINKQKEICNKIYKVKELIDKQKKIIDHFNTLIKARFVEMFGDVNTNKYKYNIERLDNIAEELFAGGDKPNKIYNKPTGKSIYPVYANGYENEGLQGYSDVKRVSKPAITISARGTIGYCFIRHANFTPIVRLITIVPNDRINLYYLKYSMEMMGIKSSGTSQAQVTVPDLKKEMIIVPPIDTQNDFAAFVHHIDKLKFE